MNIIFKCQVALPMSCYYGMYSTAIDSGKELENEYCH